MHRTIYYCRSFLTRNLLRSSPAVPFGFKPQLDLLPGDLTYGRSDSEVSDLMVSGDERTRFRGLRTQHSIGDTTGPEVKAMSIPKRVSICEAAIVEPALRSIWSNRP